MLEIDSVACALLSTVNMVLVLLKGNSFTSVTLNNDMKQFYYVLLFPMLSPSVSIGTALICWAYFALTFYSVGLSIEIVIIAILGMYIRREEIGKLVNLPVFTKLKPICGAILLIVVAVKLFLTKNKTSN